MLKARTTTTTARQTITIFRRALLRSGDDHVEAKQRQAELLPDSRGGPIEQFYDPTAIQTDVKELEQMGDCIQTHQDTAPAIQSSWSESAAGSAAASRRLFHQPPLRLAASKTQGDPTLA